MSFKEVLDKGFVPVMMLFVGALIVAFVWWSIKNPGCFFKEMINTIYWLVGLSLAVIIVGLLRLKVIKK